MRRFVLSFLILCVIHVLLFPAAAHATTIDELQDEKSQKEQRLAEVSSEIAEKTADREEATIQLDQLYAELDALADELAQAVDALEQTNYEISQLEAEIERTTQRLLEKQELLTQNIIATYKTGSLDSVEFLLSSVSLSDLLDRITYLNTFSGYFSQLIAEIQEIKAELEDQMAQLELIKAEEEAQIDALNTKISEYQAKTDEINALIASLGSEIEGLYAEKSSLEQDVSEIEQEIEIKEAEAAAAAAAEAAAAAASAAQTGSSSSGSNSGGSSAPAGGGVATAYAQVGKPYVYGATGPDSFDCSGLVCYCYGYARGRTTYAMIASLQASGDWKTSMDELNYGDLVFPSSGHVGIYIGDGMMIHASTPSTGVVIASVYSFIGGGSYY